MSGTIASTRTPCVISAEAVFSLLQEGRFDLTAEALTQRDIELVLLLSYPRSVISREHRLGPGDRPDFLVDGRIVIEVKGPRHQASAVLRQLARYAAYPEVETIILATSRAMHMPATIGGKKVVVLNLGRAWL